jgi:adhesin HecA-like repeat protein
MGRGYRIGCKRERSLIFSIHRIITALLFTVLGLTTAGANQIALTGATIINPAGGKIISNATLLLDGERIARVGSPDEPQISAETRRIDCRGNRRRQHRNDPRARKSLESPASPTTPAALQLRLRSAPLRMTTDVRDSF